MVKIKVPPDIKIHMADDDDDNDYELSEKTGLLSSLNKSVSSSSLTSSITKSYGSLVDNCQQAVKSFWNRSLQVWEFLKKNLPSISAIFSVILFNKIQICYKKKLKKKNIYIYFLKRL